MYKVSGINWQVQVSYGVMHAARTSHLPLQLPGSVLQRTQRDAGLHCANADTSFTGEMSIVQRLAGLMGRSKSRGRSSSKGRSKSVSWEMDGKRDRSQSQGRDECGCRDTTEATWRSGERSWTESRGRRGNTRNSAELTGGGMKKAEKEKKGKVVVIRVEKNGASHIGDEENVGRKSRSTTEVAKNQSAGRGGGRCHPGGPSKRACGICEEEESKSKVRNPVTRECCLCREEEENRNKVGDHRKEETECERRKIREEEENRREMIGKKEMCMKTLGRHCQNCCEERR